MRDATKEERESVAKYIDSISVSTGLNFFDLVDSDTSEKSKNSLGTDMKSCDDTIESPRRVEVNLYQEIQKTFPEILVKDLSKNERICPVCNGIGMKLTNNVYGIKGDTSEIGRKMLFPYKHQALSFCQSCFNGVQRLCPYCGKPYDERVREYEKNTCSCCRYHSMCEGKKRLPLDILKPKPSDDKAWIPGRVGCSFFEWS